MRLLITGGCGFIGSNFIRYLLEHYGPAKVTNVDALTYAGSISNVEGLAERFGERYEFYHGDIASASQMEALLKMRRYYAIINFAAESHVDRSINSPQNFIHSNVAGAGVLLDLARHHGVKRFLQVSTDEVYGSLGEGGLFTEETALAPSSPYSSSKAGADLIALSFYKTYGLEVVVTRCTNNYGPYQLPEKLIPLMVIKALRRERLPVYGDGQHVRDWIHVDDHCRALFACLLEGRPGEVYNIGASCEWRNIDVVKAILAHLGRPESLIEWVHDRPGHDRRYAVDWQKLERELQWKPIHRFESGLAETIDWYVQNESWWKPLLRRATGARGEAL